MVRILASGAVAGPSTLLLLITVVVAIVLGTARALRRSPELNAEIRQIARAVAQSIPDGVPNHSGFTFVHRGLAGTLEFVGDRTEIALQTRDLIKDVVEVIPAGWPSLLWLLGDEERIQLRGSRSEFDRIFQTRADEQILREIGVTYTLRLRPDGLSLSLRSLPGSAAALSYWIGCAFQLADLVLGVQAVANVEVTSVANHAGDGTSCQVCGSALSTGALVRCETCSTLHHEDCWDYTKSCSTFGCKSVRFKR